MLTWSHSAVQPMLPASKDLLLNVMPRTLMNKSRILSLTCFQAAQGLAAAPSLYTQRSMVHQYRLQPKLRTVIVPKAAAAESPVPHFGQLGLCTELVQALAQQHISEPTEIQVGVTLDWPVNRVHHPPQATAIPRVMQKTDTLIASHTGSGKTLAYYLPVVCVFNNLVHSPALAKESVLLDCTHTIDQWARRPGANAA